MRLLIFGKTGQLARELARRAPDATFLSRRDANLEDPERCAAAVREANAEAVINAAAYTAVDRAETDWETAFLVNARSPAAMARAAARKSVPFLHVSTDYVFDGSGERPWTPEDPTAPLNAYGKSKVMGEDEVRAAGGACAILRTSWVFSAHGSNFVKAILERGRNQAEVPVVADQVGGSTPAAAIAEALLIMARRLAESPRRSGTYHLSGAPDASRADVARAVMACAGLGAAVKDVHTAGFSLPAQRPLNSRLDCTSLTETFGIERPCWRGALRDVLTDLARKAD